jgi:hypothetical protein
MSRTVARPGCREIRSSDLDTLVNLLAIGHHSDHREWARRIKRFSQYEQPEGFPRYGYLLEHGKCIVGSIFMIFVTSTRNGVKNIKCYLGSWYVVPEFRVYAAMLASHALRFSNVTYVNATPTAHVIPILEAQRYQRFCEGRFIAIPVLSRRSCPVRVQRITSTSDRDCPKIEEMELLQRHSAYGCISTVCRTEDGDYAFVFQRCLRSGVVPFARLIYCRDLRDFVLLARPLGNFLISLGLPLVNLDANCPIEGLVGKYSSGYPKFFRGPDRPRLGDMAYSTRVIFDLSR